MKIAIIGSGISGLTCAHSLYQSHEVSLFEANDYFGGHTSTKLIEYQGETHNIDTGFIVFNKKTYPNFVKLLDSLKVAYQPSEMSFSLHCPLTGFEYNGSSLNHLFVQRRNLINLSFYRLLYDIYRFNTLAKHAVENKTLSNTQSLQSFLHEHQLSGRFAKHYLIPMAAAIWTTPQADILDFPIKFLTEFYYNHGLLNVIDRPQWYVIKGGSKTYVEALLAQTYCKKYLSTPVDQVIRHANGVTLKVAGKSLDFDKVIIATHSDQALAMLASPSEMEKSILSGIRYSPNDVILHTDTAVMPKRRKAFASWNYYLAPQETGSASLSYYMNRLQGLDSQTDFIVSVNQRHLIHPNKILGEYRYSHPLLNQEASVAQRRYEEINGKQHTFYCGAYWRYGFHEDGVYSALRVLESIAAIAEEQVHA